MDIGPYTHDEFMDKAKEFHGYPAPGLIIGGYMFELAHSRLPKDTLFDAISETALCLPDAVQLLSKCSIGNQWLKILNLGIYALTLYDKYTGKGFRVNLDPDKLGPYGEIETWFFKLKPKKDQDTPLLQAQIKEAGQKILSIQEVQVSPEFMGHKSKGKIIRCPLCGEAYPQAFGGICRSCQGESPYAEGPGLAWTRQPGSTAPFAKGPELKAVDVQDAVGKKALHDMTRIDPGQSKGAEFQAGDEIGAGDVCRLQQMGRNRVYIDEDGQGPGEDWVHEDQAARAFSRAMMGEGVEPCGDPREGKVDMQAACDGLLQVDVARLTQFNLVPDVMCGTRHNYTLLRKGTKVAGTRAIPLYLSRVNFAKAAALLEAGPLFSVKPLRAAKIGVLVTGTEVFQGLIEDKFEPIITQKAESLGCTVIKTILSPDKAEAISAAAKELMDAGADLIITTAGLSVDPDDVTRQGLCDAGLTDALHGTPVLPGAMTLIGRIGSVQVLGVPACALFFKTTSLDLLLPRLLADVEITRTTLAELAHGGLCMECKSCAYPKCPFGK